MKNIHTKTLYISDLDGTLLNNDKVLSEYTVNALNKLICRGLDFSVATARSSASAVQLLSQVNITVPIVLMNGVLIYDTKINQFVNVEKMSRSAIKTILKALRETGQTGFMYTIEDNQLCTYYERLESKPLKDFYQERVDRYYKKFTQIDNFASIRGDIIYFTFLDKECELLPVYERIKAVEGISIELYRDIYTEDLWYMECFSGNATKGTATAYLREKYGYDKIVGFGDNLNDITLFNACDVKCAVANAKEALKKIATHVTDTNERDGVVKWIEEHYEGL